MRWHDIVFNCMRTIQLLEHIYILKQFNVDNNISKRSIKSILENDEVFNSWLRQRHFGHCLFRHRKIRYRVRFCKGEYLHFALRVSVQLFRIMIDTSYRRLRLHSYYRLNKFLYLPSLNHKSFTSPCSPAVLVLEVQPHVGVLLILPLPHTESVCGYVLHLHAARANIALE